MNLLKIIGYVLEALSELLTPEKMKEVADRLLDKIEDAIAKSENKYDDLLLPLIQKLIREPFNIPDNDEPTDPE